MNNTIQAANQIFTSNKQLNSQHLVVMSYCDSILQQPSVDFSALKGQVNGDKLIDIGNKINAALATAQQHATNYENSIAPNIITNISNISNYYALHKAIATTLPPGASENDWVKELNVLEQQTIKYQSLADNTVTSLQKLHSDLTSDSAAFTELVTSLNALVDGDNGMLKSIDDQLSSIQSKIDGAIAGIVLSGLAIVGGVFMVAVGAIADFVTAGTSTPLIVAGVAVIAAGVGGEVASALTLKALNDSKGDLLTQKTQLKSQVALAQGISSGYVSLKDQVNTAATAATQMSSAWSFLKSDLGNLADNLNNGIISTDEVRTLFLVAANDTITSVEDDIKIIKHQMTGYQPLVAPKGMTIGDFIVQQAHSVAA